AAPGSPGGRHQRSSDGISVVASCARHGRAETTVILSPKPPKNHSPPATRPRGRRRWATAEGPMAFMLTYLKVPLTWWEILRRTIRESLKDDCVGLAAQLAYYFFFALFPALLFLVALASYFPLTTLI